MTVFYKTLEEAEKHPKETFSPQNIARIVGMDPYTISLKARDEKCRASLGFPVMLSGEKNQITKIPKAAFLKFMRGE